MNETARSVRDRMEASCIELTELIENQAGLGEAISFFVYDLTELRNRVLDVVSSLPDRCNMYYAVKANSAVPILECIAPYVSGFEVASGGEIDKVHAANNDVPIIFGGPAKTTKQIRNAIAANVERIHVDSVLELYRISQIASGAGRDVEVLLRVNLAGPFPDATLKMAGCSTQFGIDEADLPIAIQAVSDLPGVRFSGFHLHSISNNLDFNSHLSMLEHYQRVVQEWEVRFGISVDVLNVGGGIGVNYQDPSSPFDWMQFTEGLSTWVESLPTHWREIQFECGRFIAAMCGRYAVEVVDAKRIRGVAWALVRGGTHHFRLPASWQHSHPFTVVPIDPWKESVPRPEFVDERITVVGELCTPKDVLAKDALVGRLRVGDVLVFELAGAYGWDISHHDFLSHDYPLRFFLDGSTCLVADRRNADDSVQYTPLAVR